MHRWCVIVFAAVLCCVCAAGAVPAGRPIVRTVPSRAGPAAATAYVASDGEEDWAALRIAVSAADLDDPARYCTQEGETRASLWGYDVPCLAEDVLTPEKRAILLDSIVPAALRLHAERLLVRPTGAPLVMPPFSGLCAGVSVPEAHGTDGIADADFALYVAAGPLPDPNLAFAETCATGPDGRPIAGAMNFRPAAIAAAPHAARVAAREIARALGFNYANLLARGMTTTVPGVRGKAEVTLVSSPRVVEKARAHFGCDTLEGMELEDEGGNGVAHEYWERRNAKDELMAPPALRPSLGFYSALTMAVFEDMLYYKARWGMEEPMAWGNGAGCGLLSDKCLTDGVTKHPAMFCAPDAPDAAPRCTSDRQALGRCQAAQHRDPLPEHFQYFADPSLGGRAQQYTDHCPFVVILAGLECTTGNAATMPGSLVGAAARCLDGDGLQVGESGAQVAAVCAEISCKDGAVHVRHLGDDAWHPCPEGDAITPVGPFSAGRIVCPKYSDVCAVGAGGESLVRPN